MTRFSSRNLANIKLSILAVIYPVDSTYANIVRYTRTDARR